MDRHKSPSHYSHSSPYSPASEASSSDFPRRPSLLSSMQRPEMAARSESPSYGYGNHVRNTPVAHTAMYSRRPSSSNITNSNPILPMKAMIKETERNRREASVEETKTNLMSALS